MTSVKKMWLVLISCGLSAGALAVPIVVSDLGELDGNTGPIAGSLDPNAVNWYSFTASGFTFLDITTRGSDFDTQIGLYDAFGNLVGSDDDDGRNPALSSTLSFGVGSGRRLGNPIDLGGDGRANGEDGPLAAGTYYLAIGEFNVDFLGNFLALSTGFDDGGQYELRIFSDATPVTAPATLLLMGIGLAGIGLARRRTGSVSMPS